MALKALDIFKLTPKKNCKDCGFPTCMAFSMKVASGAVEVSKCPHMSDDSIAKLSEATAPLMRALKVGSGTSEYELGAETVLFRHEKTLVNRNRYAVAFDDSMTNEQIDFKIANMKAVNYIRIGEEMKAEMVVLEYRYNKDGFLNLVNRVNESGLDVTHIIICDDVDIAKEAIEILKDIRENIGLYATCGIGPNMLMAKVAMDTEAKHNDDFIAKWTYDDIPEKLWSISPLSKMWGIGPRMEKKLNRLGIYSIKDLAYYDRYKLKDKFGVIGAELWNHANGIDMSRIKDFEKVKEKSYSHSQVLFKDYNGENIKIIIREMVEVLCAKLRKNNKSTI